MQDKVGNVRWDIPATAGYEEAPLTILQAHMDMVVVSDDGRDMTKSPITIVVNKAENKITSDGHNHTIKHRVYIQRKLAVRKRRLLAPPACQQSDRQG